MSATYVDRAAATLESGRVTRYHAVPSVQAQNVAHHSWGVAIIALFITEGKASAPLLRECLMHDSGELFTGDVPFTVKRDNPDIKERFNAMEDTARNTELLLAPIELDLHDRAVLKISDTLEGFIWCRKTENFGPVKDRWVQAFDVCTIKFKGIILPEEMGRAKELFNAFYHA